jgi:hypothetical protein
LKLSGYDFKIHEIRSDPYLFTGIVTFLSD